MTRRRPSRLKKTGKIWIFCEGSTEKRYFDDLRVIERVKMQIVPREAGVTRADQIIEKAIRFMINEYDINGDLFDKKRDRIACVFDRDDNNTDNVFERIRKESKDTMILGYSNPSFEYWLLCHKGFFNSSSYDQADVLRIVIEKFGFDPKKELKLYEKTRDDVKKAIMNAKKIEKIHQKNNVELISRDSTPLTLVYSLIEIINTYQ